MLVGVPPVLAREGLRARALGAGKGAQQDDEEERELDLLKYVRSRGRTLAPFGSKSTTTALSPFACAPTAL
jgi:hypothetical protein